jgi:RHH-type proline utilization regulon transcriptional repressor/proline dehydrogenase/delta 1-pyrroline-5-carboxylate dehydrogenase
MFMEVSDLKHTVMQDEFFAPILAMLVVDDFKSGIEKLNDCSYGLTAAVFSRHPEHLIQAQELCEVGNLYLNRNSTGAMVGRQPFGGMKRSGTGRKAGGPGYLQQFADAKTVTENSCRHGFVGE